MQDAFREGYADRRTCQDLSRFVVLFTVVGRRCSPCPTSCCVRNCRRKRNEARWFPLLLQTGGKTRVNFLHLKRSRKNPSPLLCGGMLRGSRPATEERPSVVASV